MTIRKEVLPFLGIAVAAGAALSLLLLAVIPGLVVAALLSAGLLYFFRDPDRHPPDDDAAVLSGADGRVMSVTRCEKDPYLHTACVRISVFLSLFNVHVNRSPLSGSATFIGYFPGKTCFAFREKSSEVNQNNRILIEGARTRCWVAQIVGPFARRVVYWLNPCCAVPVKAGDRIGMMKFGSRLDIYLPDADVEVLVTPGDRVRAGETPIARIRSGAGQGGGR